MMREGLISFVTNLVLLMSMALVIPSHRPAYAADSSTSKDSSFIPASLAQSDRIKVDGWDTFLSLGLTGNVSDNHNVVGKTDGQATTVGGKIGGAIDFKERYHEWLNSFDLLLSYSRTPQMARYVKADDNFFTESLYKYYLSNFSGSFARLNLETSMAPGFDERQDQETYLVRKTDGSTQTVVTDHFALTQGLKPLKIRESIGVFTNLWDEGFFRMDLKGGLGMRQVLAARQRILADDKSTDAIEVDQLRDTQKAGYELGSEIGGGSEDKRFTYKLTANALLPFYESPKESKTGRSVYDKRVLDVNGKISFHLTDWAALDFVYKMVRDPSITDDAQISQSYLFSLNKVLAARKS